MLLGQVPAGDGIEKIVMKIRGPPVDMLIEIAPEIHQDKWIYESGVKVIYIQVLKAIYGLLVSAMLFY